MRSASIVLAACLAMASCAKLHGAPTESVVPSAESCAQVRALLGPELTISEASAAPAGIVRIPFPPPGAEVSTPDHCLVRGIINPRVGVGGRQFGIGFELRMPMQWNGRFLFQGGGGLDGIVAPALGPTNLAQQPALAQGFAVVSMDAGHQGMDASFAVDPQARIDYAYNALQATTREAKRLIAAFYRREPHYSYFAGCSNGGRQGMLAAQKYPELFDGVLAGAPAFRVSHAVIAEVWDTAQFARISPRDEGGRPIISRAFSDAELQLVSRAVLDACDALDGLADGMINNWRQCRFDPAALRCAANATGGCLSAEKVATLAAVFDGPRDSAGRSLYSSWTYDAGIGDGLWRMWKLGTSPTGVPNGANQTLGQDAFARYFATPPQANLNPETFNFDTASALVAESSAITDAASTDLGAFSRRGGRLLIYHGISDPVFSANDIGDWYDGLVRAQPDAAQTTRLFMIPGMTHCLGGPATNEFDALGALQAWVERGEAPDRIVARGPRFPGVTRPLCPYPKYAHFIGGDAASEARFECRAAQ